MRNQFFNQFFYVSKLPSTEKLGEFTISKCSINIDKIIRTIELSDGRVLILLDDLHQRPVEIEIKNKQGRVTAIKREMQIFQSEIYLTEEQDIKNFHELTNIAL